jgi:nicotinate phosphoribosyltransferase
MDARRTPRWLAGPRSALLTDLYQLTMLKSYVDRDMHGEAVFEFFARRLPEPRNFLLAAGLEQLLDVLGTLCFDDDELEWLEEQGYADRKLLDYLRRFRFAGDVYAVPEGTVVFADEPIVRIVAPLPQAQLVESRLINLIHFQTLIASKAARSVLAAPERLLVDFGMRRAHGAEAALLAARAAYVAGFSGTATVLAGQTFGIPLYGTMAHSFVQAHASEEAAFEAFAHSFPGNVVLLIDTYDTLRGARKVAQLVPKLRDSGIEVRAVRIDSGDLLNLSKQVRDVLDSNGAREVGIFASGSLNEYELERLIRGGAPIVGFGVGTELDISSDAPFLDCAYKLQEYAGRARRKRSSGKATWPGRKQVFRSSGEDGRSCGDTIGLETEDLPGDPLLVPVMRSGTRLQEPESLAAIRERTRASLAALPQALHALRQPADYPVEVTREVRELAAEIDRAVD